MTNIFSSFFQVAGAKSFSDFLKENDCKIYLTDLDKKEYNSKDILSLTDNINL